MSVYLKVFENYKTWIAEKTVTNNDFFEQLSQGQTPEILYIGCSDSRVTVEDMVGIQPSEIREIYDLGI